MALPTGIGKSLLAWCYAKLVQARVVILTGTKGLMDQYLRDFRALGLLDIRGMGNYRCMILPGDQKCDVGPCLLGEDCIYRVAGCKYYDKVKQASRTQVVVSNYDWWFSHPDEATGLGPRDVLICDEAHTLPGKVARSAGVHFNNEQVQLVQDMKFWGIEEFRTWARVEAELAEAYLKEDRFSLQQKRDIRRVREQLLKLDASATEEWVWDYIPGRFLKFEPISAAPYAEPMLWRGIPKVVLLSAIIRAHTMMELGVPDRDEYSFLETPSPFPAWRRPIYWLKIGVRMKHTTSVLNSQYWAAKIDQVIRGRLHGKGIIHTVSYGRAKWLKQNSQYGNLMLLHKSSDIRQVVDRFKTMPPPAILVSPSVHTGWDFPYEDARWQIIGKVPFPDCREGIAKARQDRDKKWQIREAIDTIVQMAGRVVRARDDLGETFIIDDVFGDWVYPRHLPWFPRWFREAFKPVDVAPPALF